MRALLATVVVLAACRDGANRGARQGAGEPGSDRARLVTERDRRAIERMIEHDLVPRGIRDARVLEAMRRVPRHELVPEDLRAQAYGDSPLPIGYGQTISQPYIVAAMTEAAGVAPGAKVLDVGTGSGYQAAVLAELGARVWSIEIVPELAQRAARDLARIGYGTVTVRAGDGYRGWREHAPFDAILVAAAPPEVPAPLIEQLAVGGRLVIPVGDDYQELRVITRTRDGSTSETLFPVRFVPMTGEAQRHEYN